MSDYTALVDQLRECKKCGETKPIDQFRVYKAHGKEYIRWTCRACELAYNRKWQKENPEKRKAQNRRYYRRNKDKVNAYARKWAAEHPKKRKEIERRARQKHRERDRIRKMRWRHANPGKSREMGNRRRALELDADGDYTAKEWRRLCRFYDNRCLACGLKKKLEVDHVVPLTKGGSNDLSNLQPLCRSCNSKKGTKIIDYRPRAYEQASLL